jgi:hypothetical protein
LIATKKYGEDVYKYFRRFEVKQMELEEILQDINGKTWKEAADKLGVPIPMLFTFLEHAMRVGAIREVKIR